METRTIGLPANMLWSVSTPRPVTTPLSHTYSHIMIIYIVDVLFIKFTIFCIVADMKDQEWGMGVWEWGHLITELCLPFLTGCCLCSSASSDEGGEGGRGGEMGERGVEGGETREGEI